MEQVAAVVLRILKDASICRRITCEALFCVCLGAARWASCFMSMNIRWIYRLTRNRAEIVVLCLCAIICTGCRTTGPNIPAFVDPSKSAVKYTAEQFKIDESAYRAALTSKDFARATMLRDGMINRVRLEIDGNYHIFEAKVFASRAAFATAADWVELILWLARRLPWAGNTRKPSSASY